MTETMRDRLIAAIDRTDWFDCDGSIDLGLVVDAVLAEMGNGPDKAMLKAGCDYFGPSWGPDDVAIPFTAMIRAARASPRRHREIDERRQAEQQHPHSSGKP